MDRLQALRTFIKVAEHSSFAEAARQLRLSPTTVTRTVRALETELGVPLLMRTTRSVRLTDEGAVFLERCRAAISDIDEAFETARGGAFVPQGSLTVTAPVVFGRLHILPIVTELLQLYPMVRVRLLLLDRVVRLVEEGVDIAVRIADLPDSSMHMLRVGKVRRVLVASPDYLSKRGEPARMSDLRGHDHITLEDDLRTIASASGKQLSRLRVNSVDAGVAAAVAGLGIVSALSYQVADHVAEGRLKEVLPDPTAPELPISLLFQGGRKDWPTIRAFIDVARQYLSGARLS